MERAIEILLFWQSMNLLWIFGVYRTVGPKESLDKSCYYYVSLGSWAHEFGRSKCAKTWYKKIIAANSKEFCGRAIYLIYLLKCYNGCYY